MRMKDNRDMYRGSQVVYIPAHAKNHELGLNHPDVEFGFVNSFPKENDKVFVRYWNKNNPTELRTKSCSELTNIKDLLIWVSVPQSQVDAAIAAIDKGVY